MFARQRLAALALLAAAVGCADHDPSPPIGGPAEVAGPEAGPPLPGDAPEARRLERQARRLARALDDPAFRQYLRAQLAESPVIEHKLQFQRFLVRDGRRALGAMARADGEAEASISADANEGIAAEVYFPVPGQLERWSGGPDLLVATALGDHDAPVAFDTRGRRVLLDPKSPPATPVLALVPQESDFDRPGPPVGVICEVDCSGGGGGGTAGGGSGGPSGTPPSQSLYLTRAQFVDTFEGWLKGNPEFELHVLGPVSSTDSATMVSFQCVGEHAPSGYQWDMNGTNWSSSAGAKVFTQAQMDAMSLTFPGKSYLILALEDDDTACEIKAKEDRFGTALEALKNAYQGYIGVKDVKVLTPGGIIRVIVAAKSGASLITAIANLIKTNDDLIGIAMADSVLGRTSPVGHWAVMEGKTKVNGWLNLEMK
ncbi:MAG TPA: hypothetical protein PK948_03620 [Gemmatimonadales bacterium]|nr:hypothetical protein [Gemmatimonadales bacterium]